MPFMPRKGQEKDNKKFKDKMHKKDLQSDLFQDTDKRLSLSYGFDYGCKIRLNKCLAK